MAKAFNIDVPDIPQGYTPLEAVVAVKCLDKEGILSLVVRSSDSLTAWEAVGMLIAASDMHRVDIQHDFVDEDDEPPDHDHPDDRIESD